MNQNAPFEITGTLTLSHEQIIAILSQHVGKRFGEGDDVRIHFTDAGGRLIEGLVCKVEISRSGSVALFPGTAETTPLPFPEAPTDTGANVQEKDDTEERKNPGFQIIPYFRKVILRGEEPIDPELVDLDALIIKAWRKRDYLDRKAKEIIRLRYRLREKEEEPLAWEEVAGRLRLSPASARKYHSIAARLIRIRVRQEINRVLWKRAGRKPEGVSIDVLRWPGDATAIYRHKFQVWNIRTLGDLIRLGTAGVKNLSFSENTGEDARLKREIFDLLETLGVSLEP